MKKRVGILALQGCVEPHVPHLESLGVDVIRVKDPKDLDACHGLIIPGGESTTFLKLIDLFGFVPALQKFFNEGKAIWGICAGAILIAKTVRNPDQKSLGFVNCEIERNAYGRQLESREIPLRGVSVALIRAPKIKTRLHENVIIKDRLEDEILGVKEGQCTISTFHPELSSQVPSPFHREFVESLSPMV
jgi:5'-phosphate synthase pdxT subunit